MGVPAHIPPARRLPRGCSHSRMCKVTVYEKFRLVCWPRGQGSAPGTAREPSNCAPFSCQGSLAALGGGATLDSGSFVAHLEVSAPGKGDGFHLTREGRRGCRRCLGKEKSGTASPMTSMPRRVKSVNVPTGTGMVAAFKVALNFG